MLLVLAVSGSVLAHSATSRMLTANNLRCEYRTDPIGVDATHPRFSWTLEGPTNSRQTAYRVIVSTSSALLKRNVGDLWDTGRVESTRQNNIEYGGLPIVSRQICFWKVLVWSDDRATTSSKSAQFETGILNERDWVAAWLNDGKSSPKTDAAFYLDDPAPLFRKEFTVRGPVERARLYVTGLGYYEASINGHRIGDHVLDPGWTKFDNRTNYSVYDVTKSCISGLNCIGMTLGNGWYNPLPLKLFGSFNLREHLAIGRPRFIAQLHIEYRDGSTQTIASDRSWQVGDGSVLRNNIYLGEHVDFRKEQVGWNRPGFDTSQWRTPDIASERIGTLIAQPQPPIRVTSQWNAVGVAKINEHTFIYDFGVNFAGWVSLKFNLLAGTQVHLRYGELVNKDGTLNPMTSVAGQIKGFRRGTKESAGGPGAPEIAWQADSFVARGGAETYTPKFTFHGFRYVEVTGIDGPLPLGSVTAMRLNTDVDDAGAFECSLPMLNQIQAICRRTFKSNIFSVQSDCPHRERLGYGGDIVATSEAMMMNFDMATFYEKVVRDWSDSARPDGMFTDTAPFMGIQYCGVIWAMAPALLIDQLHRYYGDQQIAATEYEASKRWLSLVEKKYPDGIVTDGLSDHEALEGSNSSEMVTPLYFECANLLARTAGRLSRSQDQAHCQQLAEKIRAAYQSRFIDPKSGKVGAGTQACQSFALYTGIAPDSARRSILDYLLRDIAKHRFHLSTGILGTKFMLEVLSREGHADVAFQIATQPDFPGWGWMLKNSATTLWEHWALSENTFSHNHPMFGSVSQWMMNWLGGIQPAADCDGFDQIVIRPQVPKGLDWVKSSYRSVRGKIVSNWSRQGNLIKFEVQIPANTIARICLPTTSRESIAQDGKPLSEIAQIRPNSIDQVVGSGHFVFEIRSN